MTVSPDLTKDVTSFVGHLGDAATKLGGMNQNEQEILSKYVVGEMLGEVGNVTGNPLLNQVGDAFKQNAWDQAVGTPGLFPKAEILKDFIDFKGTSNNLTADIGHIVKDV